MNITTSTNIEAKVVTEEAVLFNNFLKKITKVLQSVQKTLKLNLNVIFEDFCPCKEMQAQKII